MGVNKVILIGNLCSDPILRRTNSDQAVVDFSLAMNESYKDKQGNKVEKVEFIKVIFWGKQAELCDKYLNKGSQVFIEGKIQTRSWEDKQGAKRYTTEVVGNNVQFLSGGNKQEPRNAKEALGVADTVFKDNGGFEQDEIPF